MSEYKLIFVHGYRASHETNWFPAIAEKLTQLGVDFVIPDLPGHRQPDRDAWIEIIRQEVERATKPVILIGHSLGTRAILLYLETYQPTKVKKVILFSPPANWIKNGQRWGGTAYPLFFDHTIDMEKIKHLSEFVVVHAKDDHDTPMKPGLDYAQGASLAQELGARLISPETGGHFLTAESAPAVMTILEKELSAHPETFTWIRTDTLPTDYPITQSSGVIFNDKHEILIGSMHHDGVWNLFGGSPEPGETPEEALKRELIEEGDVTAKNIHLVGVVLVYVPHNPNTVEGEYFYQARYICDVDQLLAQTPDPDEQETTVWERRFVSESTITDYIDWGEDGKALFTDAIELHHRLTH